MSLARVIFRWLKTKYWGVGFESQLPPEFIITRHAERRLKSRLDYPHRHQMPEIMLNAWYDGDNPPEEFNPERANRPGGFKKFVYKYHLGYIWIWGVKHHTAIPHGQKYMLTVYRWKK